MCVSVCVREREREMKRHAFMHSHRQDPKRKMPNQRDNLLRENAVLLKSPKRRDAAKMQEMHAACLTSKQPAIDKRKLEICSKG